MRIGDNTPNPEVVTENSVIALFIAVFIEPDTNNYGSPDY
jgi:hypothetical protein